jgi:hypothetical protein
MIEKVTFAAHCERIEAIFASIFAGLPEWSKTDPEMKVVHDYIGYREYAEAVANLCALAARHGDYGTVREPLLALAHEMGEHDFTPNSPISY